MPDSILPNLESLQSDRVTWTRIALLRAHSAILARDDLPEVEKLIACAMAAADVGSTLTLAEDTGISVRRAANAARRLQQRGYVMIERFGDSNMWWEFRLADSLLGPDAVRALQEAGHR